MAGIAAGQTEMPKRPYRRSYLSIKMAFIGKPFSGKEETAQRLAERYNARVLRVGDMIQDATLAHESPHEPSSPETAPLIMLGHKIKSALGNGETIDDDTVVELIVATIEQLNRNSKAAANDPAAEASWILLDYPHTKEQAQKLEERLSGYLLS
jgi:adenylate kinase family enzyme